MNSSVDRISDNNLKTFMYIFSTSLSRSREVLIDFVVYPPAPVSLRMHFATLRYLVSSDLFLKIIMERGGSNLI